MREDQSLSKFISSILWNMFAALKDLCCTWVKTGACLGWGSLITTQSRLSTTLRKNAFENIVEKGENAGN